jgi:hypothetical protein
MGRPFHGPEREIIEARNSRTYEPVEPGGVVAPNPASQGDGHNDWLHLNQEGLALLGKALSRGLGGE